MGSCGITKRKHVATLSQGVELTRGISVSPSNFVIESHMKFGDQYSMGKKLGGGMLHYLISNHRRIW